MSTAQYPVPQYQYHPNSICEINISYKYLTNSVRSLIQLNCMCADVCRFSSLSQSYVDDRRDYLRGRREERSQYMQRKKARYASSRKSRYFAHMDYATNTHRVGSSICFRS